MHGRDRAGRNFGGRGVARTVIQPIVLDCELQDQGQLMAFRLGRHIKRCLKNSRILLVFVSAKFAPFKLLDWSALEP